MHFADTDLEWATVLLEISIGRFNSPPPKRQVAEQIFAKGSPLLSGGEILKRIEIIMREIEGCAVSETVLATLDEESHFPVEKSNSDVISFPGLRILIKEQLVYRDGVLLPLTHLEFHTLVYLVQHIGWIIPAEKIYEDVWEETRDNRGTAVVNIISQLRHKLTPDTPKGGFIQTVTGLGYKFEVPT